MSASDQNESLKKDIVEEVKKLFMKQNDEQFEHLRRTNDDLQKKYENEIGQLKKEHEKEIGSLKKDIIEEVKELFKKQNDEKLEHLQQEIMELKEKLHAKIATDETNDNLNFLQDTVINPCQFQEEYIMNTEITIKEEPIE